MKISLRAFVCVTFAAVPALAVACEGKLHIEIENTGVYALDHAAIVAQQPGLANCASEQLVMSSGGKPVPIRIVDGGDGRFDANDRIEWVGEQLKGSESWYNPFSINNVYLLGVSETEGARIRDALPGDLSDNATATLQRVLHYEQENLMIRLDQSQQAPGEEPDVWQWAKITHADPAPFEFTFDLPDIDTRRGAALELNFRGLSRAPSSVLHEKLVDHAAEVTINGRSVSRLSWSGRDEVVRRVEIPSQALKARGNTLRLVVPTRSVPWDDRHPLVDVVMFNWAQFQFAVSGDIDAGPLPLSVREGDDEPIRLGWRQQGDLVLYGLDGVRRPGHRESAERLRFAAAPRSVELLPVVDGKFNAPFLVRAVAADDWKSPLQGYDYLIVTHSTLRDAIRPLAAFHESRGMRVAVIDVQDVYDSFNHGIVHPQAIRNLVEHANTAWPAPHPRFLLLVGDASFDIRNNTENDLRYAKFADNMHELAYSGHFAGIGGTSYGEGATKFAGRNLIPTWQYPSPEGQSASDNPYGIVGDGFHPTVAVGRFPVVEPAEVTAIVDKTIDYMTKPQPGSWRRDVMFITDESDYFKKSSDEIADSIGSAGFVADRVYASAAEADNLAHQSAIKDGLNAGQLLVHFIGHGGRYIWRTGPPDIRKNHDLFTLDDVSNLTNSGRLPMVLSMTCYSAPFDNPSEDSIGERFLREPDKGAIAVFAASWRNAPSKEFSTNLVTELLTPGATIGEGIVRAKKSIQDRTLVEMYNLLGDPAVVLERPRDSALLARDGDIWNPGIVVALDEAEFRGQIDLDWFDENGDSVARTSFQSDESRFRLPIPKLTDGKVATSVRLYSTDRITGRDASAGLDLRPPAVVAESRWKWPSWLTFQRERSFGPLTEDTIARGGFEADEEPVLVAGN